MSHKGSEIYDVSPEQAEIIKWRAQRRIELRHQYLKEIHNPNSSTAGGHVLDPQIYRQYATNMLKEQLYNPKPNHIFKILALGFTIYGTYKLFLNDKLAKEHLYRTGQVSYRDRDWKFC